MSYALRAEQDAKAVLDGSWWHSVLPLDEQLEVDPFSIAARFGLYVRFHPLAPDESGNIVMPGDDQSPVVITLNSNDTSNRQRFTCAHELGHYYDFRVRHPSKGQLEIKDRRATLASAGTDADEIYANQFAAALLMPAGLVQRLLSRGMSLATMARVFGTSRRAMELRLLNLGLA